MAELNTRIPVFKPAKDIEISWDNFRKGLNLLLKETEVGGDELVQSDNLVLVGKGVPTKRWGTKNYFTAGATGAVRGLKGLYKADGTNRLLCITDEGFLKYKSGASYTMITGASWASGYDVYMAQLADNMYIVNGQRELVKYSNATLYSFPTISVPSNVFATQVSGVSGTSRYSYRVSAVSNVGETKASTPIEATNCPQDLINGTVKVSWTGVSAASGILKGYNVYGRVLGDERFIGSVGNNTTSWFDDGVSEPYLLTYPPLADATGGVTAKYITRFEDRLIFAGIDGDPSKVVFGGKEPLHEKLDLASGGNYIRIEPDAGDDITGIGIFESRIIVFKERSIWQITLTQQSVGNFTVTIPNLQLITASHGCIAPKSIVAVENDVFFLTRKGVYSLGYEPNVLNVLRTNEISAKVRPFFENLSVEQKVEATATYYNFKYILTFPGKNKTLVYDRERMSWIGPWNLDSNTFEVYYDDNNDELLLSGKDDSPEIIEWNDSYDDDEGITITTQLRTRKEDFKDWARFKNIRQIFTLFRNVRGTLSVEIRLQQRDGQVTTAKSFNIQTTSSTAGWGADMWGSALWGDSESSGGATDINELYRWISLNKAARTMQIIIKTNNRNDNYELLAVKAIAKPLGLGFLPSSEKI